MAIDGERITLKGIVLRENAPDILLGTDHPLTRSLLTNRPVHTQARAITTRAQSQSQSKEWAEDTLADARDGDRLKSHPDTSPMPEPSKSQDQLTTPLSANASPAVASPVEGATIDGSPRATPLFEEMVEK